MKITESVIQLNGGLDTRSTDGACGQGWFRLLYNVDGAEQYQMCCLSGWLRRMYDASCQNNQDLHDQMVDGQFYSLAYDQTTDSYTVQIGTAYPSIPIYQTFPEVTTELCDGSYYLGHTCRESVTFLKSVTAVSGARRLLAGTHSRLYVSDDSGGNWRILADGLGGACSPTQLCDCSPVRMTGATLGNFTVLTNNVDEVLFWQFDVGPDGCYHWSADYVQDLRTLAVSRAAGVCEFQGLLILWDVRMNGQDFPNRILWSDFNAPLLWVPGGESVAGFTDLALGERIIAIVPISAGLRVYTNQAIYDGRVVTDDRTLVFTERYRLKGGVTSNLPSFKNGIANCGDFHVFVGQQELFMMNSYDTSPQPYEWLHRASGVIFAGLPANRVNGTDFSALASVNRRACDNLICRWSGRYRAVIISWPTGSNVCPDASLWLWTDTSKASLVNYGFTEITEHLPDTGINWRDYLGQIGLCDPSDSLLDKEGLSCPATFSPVEYTGLWNATEDISQPMDPNSVSALFCEICLEDLCRVCDADTELVLASSSDKTLKQYTPGQYIREELESVSDTTFPTTDLGTYVQRPYSMLIQSDAQQPEGPSEKTFRATNVSYTAGEATTPPLLYGQAGGGWTPGCLEWETAEPIEMTCGESSAIQRGGRPSKFNFMTTGSWLGWRVTAPAADCCVINLSVRIEEGACW